MSALLLVIFSCNHATPPLHEHAQHADSIIGRSDSLLQAGQVDHSLKFLDSAYSVFANQGPMDKWHRYYHLNGFYLNYRIDTDKARAYSDSMLMMLKGNEKMYKREYANTLFAIGDVLMAEKKYNEAFKQYYDGQAYTQKNLDSCSVESFSDHLGIIMYRQGQIAKALPYFKQAMKEFGNCSTANSFQNRFFQPQSTLNTIALCYEQMQMTDSAIFYYRKAIDFVNRNAVLYPEKKIFIAMATGVIDGNLGGAYLNKGRYKDAEYYLEKSIRINDRPGYAVTDAMTAKIKLANLYIQTGRFTLADSLAGVLKKELTAMQSNGPDKDEMGRRWHKLEWKYYDAIHQTDSAYHYQQQFYEINDAMQKAAQDVQRADMEEVFRTTEQQYRLKLLDRNDRIKTQTLWTIIVLSILVVGILLGVWYNMKRYKKVNGLVTEQNQQMRRTLTALEQSQEENTRMMKIVAHDLRNPIGGMTALSSMMLESGRFSGDDQIMLELIKNSGENSLELVSDLLQVHIRAEELVKEPVDMKRLIDRCVNLVQYKAEEKAQQIITQLQPAIVSANPQKMWRVMSNLITNAIKFSPSGASIFVKLEKEQHIVRIGVEDHGIGIPDRLKDKVFDMFTEAKRPGTAGEQTFGLGLAISKQIIDAHGGTIWFESLPGNGTTFYIELPSGD